MLLTRRAVNDKDSSSRLFSLSTPLLQLGIMLFYGIGELWRKKLQFKNVTDNQKLAIISGMTLGGLMTIYQGQSLSMPVKLTAYEVQIIELVIISFTLGLIAGLLHVRLRFREIVM